MKAAQSATMNQDFHPSSKMAKPNVLSEDVILLVELYKLECRSCTVSLLFGKLVVLRKVENLSFGPQGGRIFSSFRAGWTVRIVGILTLSKRPLPVFFSLFPL